eukprot:TRINITY_DN1928_c0_g2_i1.p1 TRINITY_DN1928_c0_g2~~TRINITY_DN1928_c0_g2_i1.p1  ORF type:complete len:537 (+),score=96.73 TRINITY_DN1928_c0_g2_i1:192-1802(+)
MASGSSGRTGSGSKAFDFGSDDVLCSYDDLGNQDASNGKRSDSVIGSNSGREFRVSRAGRSLSNIHSQQEESCNLDMISIVEMTMKKYADNILRVLEGLSGRLSQLELYCYNIEQSIGEFKSDLTRDHNEADLKLRSLEKHLQEVHRSIQILRDKQELAETQKELAKLQLAQKESPTKSRSHQTEEVVEQKKTDSVPDSQNQQLALALSHQTTIPTSLPARAPEQHQLPVQQHPPPPSLPLQQTVHFQNQPHAYYSQQNQIPNQPPLPPQQLQQDQHLQSELQYVPQRPQMQDLSRQAPQPQAPVNQTPTPSFPQYQQQWPQQFPRQVQPQQPPPQAQVRPQTHVYPPYPPQPTNPSPESMPMQVPFSGISQPGGIRPESAVYGYGGSSRTVPQQQTHPNAQRQPQNQINQSTYGPQLADGGFSGGGPLTQPNLQGYMMYDTDGSRPTHPSHFQQGSYPPSHVSALQNPQPPPGGVGVRHSGSQIMRGHPYGELIEKFVSMGYTQENVVGAIQRMEDSGQPVDFNALLDRLTAPRY